MASSIASITICRSITFSRATASAICKSSSRLALMAIGFPPSLECFVSVQPAGAAPDARAVPGARAVPLGLRFGRVLVLYRRRAPAQGFAHQLVREHEASLADGGKGEAYDRPLLRLDVGQVQQRRLALDAPDHPPKPLAAVQGQAQLDLGLVP